MGGCISCESEEIRKMRQNSRQKERQEWEKRYQQFSKKVKELYTPEVQRRAIWQNSNAKKINVHSELKGFRGREECEDFMDAFNRREKKPCLYKHYVNNKYRLDRVVIYYKIV